MIAQVRALGMAFVAPITTKPRGHDFELPLPKESRIKGVVMIHQLKSLDWRARRATAAGKVPAKFITAATEIIKDIIEATKKGNTSGWTSYVRNNPVSGRMQDKLSYWELNDGLIFKAGLYID